MSTEVTVVEEGLFGPVTRAVSLDDYYTKPECALHCLRILSGFVTGNVIGLVEPSAGSGSYYNQFATVFPGLPRVGYDLHPRTRGVQECDWFKAEPPRGYAVVGNPPFGSGGSLAIRFFNRAALLGSPLIAFVLPRSFSKASIQSRLNRNYTLVYSEDLPDNSFFLPATGEDYSCRCVFQVWARSNTTGGTKHTTEQPLNLAYGHLLSFVRSDDEWDWAVRRVGGRASQLVDGSSSVSDSTTMFLRAQPGRFTMLDSALRKLNPTGLKDSVSVLSYPKLVFIEQLLLDCDLPRLDKKSITQPVTFYSLEDSVGDLPGLLEEKYSNVVVEGGIVRVLRRYREPLRLAYSASPTRTFYLRGPGQSQLADRPLDGFLLAYTENWPIVRLYFLPGSKWRAAGSPSKWSVG